MKTSKYAAIAGVHAAASSDIPSLDDKTKCSLTFKAPKDGMIALRIQKLFVDFIFVDFNIFSGIGQNKTSVVNARHEPIGIGHSVSKNAEIAEFTSKEGFEIELFVKTKALSALRLELEIILTAFIRKFKSAPFDTDTLVRTRQRKQVMSCPFLL